MQRWADMPDGPSNELKRLRAVAVIVSIFMLAGLVVADTLGRLLIDPTFHVSEIIFASLSGTLILLLGIEGVVRLTRNGADK